MAVRSGLSMAGRGAKSAKGWMAEGFMVVLSTRWWGVLSVRVLQWRDHAWKRDELISKN